MLRDIDVGKKTAADIFEDIFSDLVFVKKKTEFNTNIILYIVV